MGRRSSDSEDNSRSRRKRRARGRSSSSSSSHSRSKPSRRRTRSRDRNRDADRRHRKRSNSSSSRGSSHRRRSRSTDRGRSHRSHRSRSRSRNRGSRSHHRRSRSRSSGRSSRKRSRSRDRDRGQRRTRDKDRPRDKTKDKETDKAKAKDKDKQRETGNIKAGLEHLTPAEQAKARLQLVLQAAAKTDEVLKAKESLREEQTKEEGLAPEWSCGVLHDAAGYRYSLQPHGQPGDQVILIAGVDVCRDCIYYGVACEEVACVIDLRDTDNLHFSFLDLPHSNLGIYGRLKFSPAVVEDAGTKMANDHIVTCIQVPQCLIPPQRHLMNLFPTLQFEIQDRNVSACHPHPTQLED